MISRRIARAAPSVSLSVLLLAACGSGQSGTGSQTGEARLQAQLRIRGDDGAETLACGAFTFQPYAVSAASTMTNAGDAIVLESNGSADSPATTIAGCIAGAEDAAGYNWAFIVTATDAADCASGEPIAVSPSVEAYMLLLDCKAGLDVPASVSLVMSPATPTAGGYVDIDSAVAVQLADGGAEAVCATVTMQPVALDLDGGASWIGDPVVFTSTPTDPQASILGCIDSFNSSDADDWGYQVSATGFTDCMHAAGGSPAPITGLAQDPVTFNLAMKCVAGQDVSLDVSVVAVQSP